MYTVFPRIVLFYSAQQTCSIYSRSTIIHFNLSSGTALAQTQAVGINTNWQATTYKCTCSSSDSQHTFCIKVNLLGLKTLPLAENELGQYFAHTHCINVATIRGQLHVLLRVACACCGVYRRATTIHRATSIQGNTVPELLYPALSILWECVCPDVFSFLFLHRLLMHACSLTENTAGSCNLYVCTGMLLLMSSNTHVDLLVCTCTCVCTATHRF